MNKENKEFKVKVFSSFTISLSWAVVFLFLAYRTARLFLRGWRRENLKGTCCRDLNFTLFVIGAAFLNATVCGHICVRHNQSCHGLFICHQLAGFGARACFRRFCSLQLGASFGHYEFPWIN